MVGSLTGKRFSVRIYWVYLEPCDGDAANSQNYFTEHVSVQQSANVRELVSVQQSTNVTEPVSVQQSTAIRACVSAAIYYN